jgi:hypothetical protein
LIKFFGGDVGLFGLVVDTKQVDIFREMNDERNHPHAAAFAFVFGFYFKAYFKAVITESGTFCWVSGKRLL